MMEVFPGRALCSAAYELNACSLHGGSFRIVLSHTPLLYGVPRRRRSSSVTTRSRCVDQKLASRRVPNHHAYCRRRRTANESVPRALALLDTRQRRGFVLVQALALVMAAFTLAGVAAVVPLFAVLGEPQLTTRNLATRTST